MALAAEGVVQPARWAIGPPAPAYISWLARCLMLALLIVVGHWVQAYLGGVSTHPTPTAAGANDTGKLFNWHPVLMTLAFGVFMAEAVLTYEAPVVPAPRPTRKRIHWMLHSLAVLCATLGVTAAYKSHTLKLPTPIPNFYSPHSFLGATTLAMLAVQFALGLTFYLYPGAPMSSRMALGPIHKFAGRATWVAGLAAMASGLQEKVTFLQFGKSLSGAQLFGGILRLPAVAVILIVLLALTVLYHHVAPAAPSGQAEADKAARQGLLQTVVDE